MHKLLHEYATWFEHTQGRAASSCSTYLGFLQRLDIFLFNKDKDLLTATRADLEAFTGAWAHQQKISPRSRRPMIASVKSFYRWATDQEKIPASPAERLVYPTAGKPLPEMITRRNAERLLLDCDLSTFIGTRDAAIIALLAATGMRVSGVASLNQEMFFSGEDDKGRAVQLLRVSEKGKKERIIPIVPEAVMYLTLYLHHAEFLAVKKSLVLPDGDNVLFIQTNRGQCPDHDWFGESRRLGSSGIQRMIIRRGERLEIPRAELHPHAFRHLFGTELAESEVDLKRIQMLMGHSSVEYTSIYIHLASRKLHDTVTAFSPLAKMHTPMHKLAEELRQHGAG